MRITLLIVFVLTHPVIHADSLTGLVVGITDGDTITLLDDTKTQHKIRLAGIDAPERKQAYGTKSKQHLAGIVAEQVVDIKYSKRDRYGRIIGKIILNDEDINLLQVSSGFAWHYKKYQKEQLQSDQILYADAEDEARDAKRGLWQDLNPIPPWDFRHNKR